MPGRRSGEPRSTPVTPITVENTQYVVSALPQSDWAQNLRAARQADIARGRTRRSYAVREVDDLEQNRTVLRAFPIQSPGGVSFYVRLGLVESADPDQFAAIADKVAVFELTPA